MVINFVEILQDFYPRITTVRIVAKNNVVSIRTTTFDEKAVSHDLYGIPPPPPPPPYLTLLQNGYRNLLQNLINELKTSTRLWVEQGEAFCGTVSGSTGSHTNWHLSL